MGRTADVAHLERAGVGVVGVVRAAADVALDHRDEDWGRLGPIQTAATEPAVPLLGLADNLRAAAVAPGRAKAASMASISAAANVRTGLPFLSTTDSMGARPSASETRGAGRTGVVLDGGAGTLHGVGLLVGTAASVAQADASANARSMQRVVGAGRWAWRMEPSHTRRHVRCCHFRRQPRALRPSAL